MRIRSGELVDLRAGDLILDARNWRDHPQYQADALAGVLEDVGIVFPVLVRAAMEGYVVVDGHLRVSLADPDDLLPCLILDLDEKESGIVLATYDPIAELAQPDLAMLHSLSEDMRKSSLAHVGSMLDIVESVLPPRFAAESQQSRYLEQVQPEYSLSDPFLYPFSNQKDVWVWGILIPLQEFDDFIALARALSAHLGFGDDAGSLVIHCLELVYATLD